MLNRTIRCPHRDGVLHLHCLLIEGTGLAKANGSWRRIVNIDDTYDVTLAILNSRVAIKYCPVVDMEADIRRIREVTEIRIVLVELNGKPTVTRHRELTSHFMVTRGRMDGNDHIFVVDATILDDDALRQLIGKLRPIAELVVSVLCEPHIYFITRSTRSCVGIARRCQAINVKAIKEVR